MRKALALAGAAAIGVGASTIAAAPAAAEPVTEPCEGFIDHLTITGEVNDNWYMDCVPQYGLGKAEFTIHAGEEPADGDPPPADEFPDGFTPLSDPSVTATTSLDPGLAAYELFDSPERRGAFPVLMQTADTPTSQDYLGLVYAPITGVASGSEENITAEMVALCEPELTDAVVDGELVAFVASFGPTDTTFTQTVDGEEWAYTISTPPPPVAFFLFVDEDELIVTDAPLCITDGVGHIAGVGIGDVDFEDPVESLGFFAYVALALVSPLPEQIEELEDLEFPELRFIGDFYRQVEEPIEEEEPTPAAPTLPATGSDVAGAAGLAGALALLGIGLASAAALRRRPHEG